MPGQRRPTPPRAATPAHPGELIDGFTLGACIHTGQMSTLFRVTKAGLDRLAARPSVHVVRVAKR